MVITSRQDARVQIPATILTIALMVFFPVLSHIIGGAPIGVRWLPMFYAPVAAALWFHPAVGLAAALLGPLTNHLLTGHPTAPMTVMLTVELVVFVAVIQLLARRRPGFWGAAAVAFVVAKLASTVLLAVLPVTLIPAPPLQYFTSSLTTGWPGMVVLVIINWLSVRAAARGR